MLAEHAHKTRHLSLLSSHAMWSTLTSLQIISDCRIRDFHFVGCLWSPNYNKNQSPRLWSSWLTAQPLRSLKEQRKIEHVWKHWLSSLLNPWYQKVISTSFCWYQMKHTSVRGFGPCICMHLNKCDKKRQSDFSLKKLILIWNPGPRPPETKIWSTWSPGGGMALKWKCKWSCSSFCRFVWTFSASFLLIWVHLSSLRLISKVSLNKAE